MYSQNEGNYPAEMKKNWDVIIVGSGFGGSVSALRLAEKGYKVLVIEKGRRYRTNDFPKTNWNLRKFFWMPRLFMYGIQCLTFLKDVFILHGAGVGGGSLVYANTLLVPPDEAFEKGNWPGKGWKEKLLPYYSKAKEMLGAVPAKVQGETDHVLRDCAHQLGKEDSFHSVDVGIYFGKPGEKNEDPYFDGKGPERAGCTLCGGCMVGCRYNAKNTLDKNYLYLAEQLGVEILSEQEVVNIEHQENNFYSLTIRQSTGIFRHFQKLQCDKLILAGGVLGTVKLLLKCKTKGSLQNLSSQLGNFVRTNSEAIIGVKLKKTPQEDYTKGIAISAGFYPDKNTHIETVRYGRGQTAMALLTTFLPDRSIPLPRFFRWGISVLRHPIEFITNLIPVQWARKTVILLVMQPISNYLKLEYKSRWWRFGGKSMNSQSNTGERIPSHIPIGEKAAELIAEKKQGTIVTSYMDSLFGIPTTAHILGGACLSGNESEGVIDENFEVYNYPGMYIIDGSSIPSNLGVNPSLTITALAEYAMSRFPDKESVSWKNKN